MLGILSATAGGFLIVLGLIIWKKELVGILAGYDEKKTTDKGGLAKWVGKNTIACGTIIVLLSLAIIFFSDVMNTLIFLWAIVIVIPTMAIIIAIGCKKYQR